VPSALDDRCAVGQPFSEGNLGLDAQVLDAWSNAFFITDSRAEQSGVRGFMDNRGSNVGGCGRWTSDVWS
jgi:hypothetical protein